MANKKRLVIELLGSPDAGKTMALKGVSERLTEKGIPNEFIIETRGKDYFPTSERGTLAYNVKVGNVTCNRIDEIMATSSAEVFLIDKGYVDYLYFVDYYLQCGKCSPEEAELARHEYEYFSLMPDKIIVLVCNPEVAASRCKDAVETRTVKLQRSIDSLTVFYNNWTATPKAMIDTSFMTKEEVILAVEAEIGL